MNSGLLGIFLARALSSAGAYAQKPEWAGGGKNAKPGQEGMQVPTEPSDAARQAGKSSKDSHADGVSGVSSNVKI